MEVGALQGLGSAKDGMYWPTLGVTKHRVETRTNCYARIGASLEKNRKYVMCEYIKEHNHSLQLLKITHMLVSHRKMTEVQAYKIDLAEDFGLRQKASFQLMSTHVGAQRCKELPQSKKMKYGQQLLENPSFFHTYHMDIDEQITNAF
ncbi:hypothetical protein CR513_11042, partial [Mucuna pruriens]